MFLGTCSMLASLHLILLLLIGGTANRDHYVSHGEPIQGRTYVDHHLKAHHISRITGSSHEDAGFPFAKQGVRHGDLATQHTGKNIPPLFDLLRRHSLRCMCV